MVLLRLMIPLPRGGLYLVSLVAFLAAGCRCGSRARAVSGSSPWRVRYAWSLNLKSHL
jgi:hypothetical protein